LRDIAQKKILLLTLVHPAFLPPVGAMAQVLRDEGYEVHILTFDPHLPTEPNEYEHIILESVGKHNGVGLLQRIAIRKKYTARAQQLAADNTIAIISFCAFSYLCALKIRKQLPVIYHALEMSDFSWKSLTRSPLSQINNYLALNRLCHATLVSTPSKQRSAWLAGRNKLSFLPETIQNTAYVSDIDTTDITKKAHQLISPTLLSKTAILYMGTVNELNCIAELVAAFCELKDDNCVLLIAGMLDNDYCNDIKQCAAKHSAGKRIVFFPYLSGIEKQALLHHAKIGLNLTKEDKADIESKMTAPNKAGEYLSKNLYLIGTETEYMKQFKFTGVASLVQSPTPANITVALTEALTAVATDEYKNKTKYMVNRYYSMQQQIKPIRDLLQKL